jgi:hypothetical protein
MAKGKNTEAVLTFKKRSPPPFFFFPIEQARALQNINKNWARRCANESSVKKIKASDKHSFGKRAGSRKDQQ